ncbi:MAG: hypothetical protein GY711_21375 [bacterium]|nr:hypothetical protein [bacterium]
MLLPRGFAELARVERRLGSVVLGTREEPPVFWVAASGFVTPSLLREDLRRAEAFGRAHSWGWDYVADTTRVRAVHPANPLLLRRIHDLPFLRRYITVAPSWATRFAIVSMRAVVRCDVVARSTEQALELVGER